MVTKKKKIPKTDPKKLMALVVDESLLESRKKNDKDSKKEEKTSEDVPKSSCNKWDNIQKSDFIKKEVKGNFYGQHKEWKKNIWIGPYSTEKELDKVINSYVTETKKDILHRNTKNIHSILIDLD